MSFWVEKVAEKVEIHTRKSSCTNSTIPLKQYRTLLALNRVGNECIGKHLFPFLVSTGCIMLILSLTTLIKFFSKLPVGLVANLTLAVIFLTIGLKEVFHGGGLLLMKSQRLKEKLMLMEANKHNNKFVKSCRDMRMYTGHYFYMQPCTFVTCGKFVVDQVITLLLSF